jgi:hypothetical protein
LNCGIGRYLLGQGLGGRLLSQIGYQAEPFSFDRQVQLELALNTVVQAPSQVVQVHFIRLLEWFGGRPGGRQILGRGSED